jgi:hypothetical protein
MNDVEMKDGVPERLGDGEDECEDE